MPRVLCAGEESNLTELRSQLLSLAGYHAQPATISESLALLSTQHFDLVIISADASDADRDRLLLAIGNRMRTLMLEPLIFPADLLVEVENLLQRPEPKRIKVRDVV